MHKYVSQLIALVKQKWKSDIEELLYEFEKDLNLLVFTSDGKN